MPKIPVDNAYASIHATDLDLIINQHFFVGNRKLVAYPHCNFLDLETVKEDQHSLDCLVRLNHLDNLFVKSKRFSQYNVLYLSSEVTYIYVLKSFFEVNVLIYLDVKQSE